MVDMLSPNFSLKELTHSDKAIKLKIDNTPTPIALTSLYILASTLELIRKVVGKPMKISSGYRSPKLNAAIGGSPSSAHIFARAADFTVQGMTPYEVCCAIKSSGIIYDQLILEFDQWVHVGISEKGVKPRMQDLTIRKGTGYLSGIIKKA
jgi:zinc D-Ala-D-Ala carboxypeptidase